MSAADELILRIVEIHLPLAPLRLPRHPRAADEIPPPTRILHRNGRCVNHHQPATALYKIFDQLLLLRRRVAAFLRISDDHIRGRDLLRCRPIRAAIDLDAALGEQLFPIRKEPRVGVDLLAAIAFAAADEDAERSRLCARDA